MLGMASPELAVTSLLGLLGLYGVVRYFLPRKKEDGETVNWTPLEAVGITIAIYFISQLLAGLLLGIFAGFVGWETDQLADKLEQLPVLQFLFILGAEALTVAFLYIFMKRRQTPWRAIGLIKPRWRDAGYALMGFGAYFVLYAFIVYNLFTQLFPQVDTEQAQELGFDAATTVGPELLFVFVGLVILPPLVEEILVRGFLFTGLKQRFNFLPAAVITSIIFAAAHLQWGSDAPLLWTAAADTFTLSMVLVYLRHKTGSLWPGIGVHFIKNGIAFVALFVFKVTA